MENKKVSVIVPVYRAEQYLEGCIQSILGQDYPNIELVLINDGSDDGCDAICEAYAEKHPNIVYRYKENGGVSSARNMGLDIASGEYIAFVDSDDRIKKNMISSLVSALEKADADMSICGYEVVLENSTEARRIEAEAVQTKKGIAAYFARHFTEAIASSVCCKLYKMQLISHRFQTELSMGEDLLFNLEYVKHMNGVTAIGDALYMYDKRNDGSLTHTYKAIYHRQNLAVFAQWRDYLASFEADCVYVHYRAVQLYLKNLFCICDGTIEGKKLVLVRDMLAMDPDASIRAVMHLFDRKHRIMLWLMLHRRYRLLTLVGVIYCKRKTRHP